MTGEDQLFKEIQGTDDILENQIGRGLVEHHILSLFNQTDLGSSLV